MNATSDTILNRAAEAPTMDNAATARTSTKSADRIAPLPAGAINIDLDTLRDYAPGYGFTYDRAVDPVYQSALPRFMTLLAELDVPATLFTIGRDAANERNHDVLRDAFAASHEPGNHTMTHPRQLSKMPPDAMRRNIIEGHDAVVLLKSRGKSREWRPGTYFHAFAPLKPYRPNRRSPWRSGGMGDLVELPLSAVPWSRLPFYGTWLHTTGKKVFDKALSSIRRSGGLLNFHFHAVELLDLNDPGVDPRFKVHPGLATPLAERRALIADVIRNFKSAYQLVTLAELAERTRNNKTSSNPSGNSGGIS